MLVSSVRFPPTEVLLERNEYSSETLGTVRLVAPKAAVDELCDDTEMPTDALAVVEALKKAGYYPSDSKHKVTSQAVPTRDSNGIVDMEALLQGTSRWPGVMKAALMGLQNDSSVLMFYALGGVLWQLKRSLIDHEVMSMGKCSAYIPSDLDSPAILAGASAAGDAMGAGFTASVAQVERALDSIDFQYDDSTVDHAPALAAPSTSESEVAPTHMVLDAVALANLEVLVTQFDRNEKGSLWAFVNRTRTPFGRRLLRDWLCKPLFQARDIHRRTAAVKDLMGPLAEPAEKAKQILKGLPDLERLLGRVHSNGLNKRSQDHPDSRAVMYEMPIYNATKIRIFADVLEGFERLAKVCQLFAEVEVQSALLARAVKATSSKREGSGKSYDGRFPFEEMSQLLKHFRVIFDEKQAKRDGTIKPKPGVDSEYDQAKADCAEIENEFQNYIREQKKFTGINDLSYWGTNKDRFQIEVPISQVSKIPENWTSKSQKKTHRRYWTPFIERKLAELNEAEERLSNAQRDTMRRYKDPPPLSHT